MNKPVIYFITSSSTKPHGGTRHLYNLCMVAEKLGITARVTCPTLYDWIHEKQWKYWLKCENTIPDIKEGDIVVSPEIFHERPMFSIPVRRVKYVQNYSLTTRQAWEKHYWSYIPEHIEECKKQVMTRHKRREQDLDKPDGGVWFDVPPMFDKNVFNPISGIARQRGRILVLDRKCPDTIRFLKLKIGFAIDSVNMLPEVSMPNQYRKVGILAIPSEAEGCCFPAVEALMCGTAVIGWPCCALETFIKNDETGVLVERDNNQQLLDETIRLAQDPKRQERLAAAGREVVLERFNEENTTIGLLNAYNYMLDVEPEL